MSRFVFFFLLLVTVFSGFGQKFYVFNRLSRDNGLNTNNVNCIWQDKKGFLWVGTENGLQRFDGRRFMNMRSADEDRVLPPISVEQITDAGNGKFWVRQGFEIGRFDPVSFHYERVGIKTSRELPARSEFRLFSDSKGNTFLCVRKYGLLIYDPGANSFVEENLPIAIPEGWPVNNLFEDARNGNYWICSDSGLAVYKTKTKELFYREHNPESIPLFDRKEITAVYRFLADQNDTWWIFYWSYLPGQHRPIVLHYDPRSGKMLNDTTGIHSSAGYYDLGSAIETQKGQLWIGGLNSLLSYEKGGNGFSQNLTNKQVDFGIACNAVKCLYEDRESNLWLCTDNGLYAVSPEQKNVFNIELVTRSPKAVFVNALIETKDKQNWVGTWGNGIFFFDEYFKRIDSNPYKGNPGVDFSGYKGVWGLCQHKASGLVWSVCQGGVAAVFNPSTRQAEYWLAPPVFERSTIRHVKEDHEGNLWFGSQKGHLAKWKNGDPVSNESIRLVRHFNTIIQSLLIDKAGRIWVGTHKQGVYVLDSTGEKELYHFAEEKGNRSSLFLETVFDIEQYNDSIFFVSTGPLNIVNIRSGKTRRLTVYEGLPGGSVTRLQMDRKGILWLTTNNGLASYNYPRNIFTTYDEKNGIVYAEKTENAKWLMQNGEIWFGGGNVVFGFWPEGLKFKNDPPEVTLTDFKLFDTFLPVDSMLDRGVITLKPAQNSFSIYFSSLSFSQQDKLEYYYQMQGLSNDWIKVGGESVANYTTLPPGRYRFRVKCVNMEGMESSQITSVAIRILPPFYKTWWFIGLMVSVAVVAIYGIYRLRINKILAVESVRNKVARDLHDDMGSTLSTINILSSMAKSRLSTEPVKTSEYLSKITDNSQRMMEAMDDIVWSIKPDNDTMQKIVARMREYSTSILEAKNIAIDFSAGEKVLNVKLNMEARRDLFLIFKETVNNIAKYSRCGRASIYLAYRDKRLVMKIKDDGIGFDVKTTDNGNGLGNMQKRATALRGRLSIKSCPGAGTEVSLNMPVSD